MLKSQLCAKNWDTRLQGYWDTQLPCLVHHGIPLALDSTCKIEAHADNHNSEYPGVIQAYLNEERKYDAILGPLTNLL